MKDKKKGSIAVKIIYTITVLFAVITIAIFFYPTVSDAWNRYVSSRLISDYISSTANKIDYSKEIEAARIYNRELFAESKNNINAYSVKLSGDRSGDKDTTDLSGEVLYPDPYYESQINVLGNQMMGYVEIPAINVSLPIYHYTSEEVLSRGLGHLYGTSLPVGGEGTHAVITGHCGLTTARIFTDLEKLRAGDRFSVSVFDFKLNYEVDQIKIVLPTEFDDLDIEEGKDYITLVTCTPYGVNTHRLLVRGHRVADDIEKTDNIENDTPIKQIQEIVNFPITIFTLCILVIIIGIFIIIRIWKKKY